MNRKKHITLSGVLMYPLAVGNRALVFGQGRFTRTSRVVAVHRRDMNEIRFETLDGEYTLLLNPFARTAGSLPAAA